MKNRLYSVLLANVVILVACSDSSVDASSSTPESNAKQPNVVFILADDMGFGDIGYNGSEIATPHLDQLARGGMTLARNYVYPVCSPTRAALLSGQNPLHHGITGPIADYASLPPDLKIMPEYFKELGYQTHMVGKWHLGLTETNAWPTAKGFDSYYGFLGGWIDFYTHVFAGGLDWQRNGVSIREEGHATDLFTREALNIIESRHVNQPFLLYLAYNAPHSPLQHPPDYSGLNNFPEVSDRSVYAEMVTHMDANIGSIVASLEEQGILEETIVVFSSDNGGALGLGANNGDLRGGKRTSLEGGLRVPGLISWSDHIEPGSTLEQQIAVHDWLPTLLDAVGGNASAVADPYGQSMWAAIAEGAQVDRNIHVMGAQSDRAVFDWPWKLVYIKANESGDESYQLYNVVDDPFEKTDRAAEYPEMTASLTAKMKSMPISDINRLEPEFNNSPRYYPRGVPTHDLRHEESREPWAEAAIGPRD